MNLDGLMGRGKCCGWSSVEMNIAWTGCPRHSESLRRRRCPVAPSCGASNNSWLAASSAGLDLPKAPTGPAAQPERPAETNSPDHPEPSRWNRPGVPRSWISCQRDDRCVELSTGASGRRSRLPEVGTARYGIAPLQSHSRRPIWGGEPAGRSRAFACALRALCPSELRCRPAVGLLQGGAIPSGGHCAGGARTSEFPAPGTCGIRSDRRLQLARAVGGHGLDGGVRRGA